MDAAGSAVRAALSDHVAATSTSKPEGKFARAAVNEWVTSRKNGGRMAFRKDPKRPIAEQDLRVVAESNLRPSSTICSDTLATSSSRSPWSFDRAFADANNYPPAESNSLSVTMYEPPMTTTVPVMP